ncbi:MAG: hypothetical protein J6X30_00905 [Clostridia bacterium]|nr:hypothetical protein [Clostridia bacterium]
MKRYVAEIVILLAQIAVFYVTPLTGGLNNPMGMVLLILLLTFALSALLGGLSRLRVKFLYPVLTALLFLPSVWLFYNESAWIHALWYLFVSFVGLGIGVAVRAIVKR